MQWEPMHHNVHAASRCGYSRVTCIRGGRIDAPLRRSKSSCQHREPRGQASHHAARDPQQWYPDKMTCQACGLKRNTDTGTHRLPPCPVRGRQVRVCTAVLADILLKRNIVPCADKIGAGAHRFSDMQRVACVHDVHMSLPRGAACINDTGIAYPKHGPGCVAVRQCINMACHIVRRLEHSARVRVSGFRRRGYSVAH